MPKLKRTKTIRRKSQPELSGYYIVYYDDKVPYYGHEIVFSKTRNALIEKLCEGNPAFRISERFDTKQKAHMASMSSSYYQPAPDPNKGTGYLSTFRW